MLWQHAVHRGVPPHRSDPSFWPPLSLLFGTPISSSFLSSFWAPKRDPKVCQNASKTCTISVLFSDLRFCFLLANFWRPPGLQNWSNMLFFRRFSIMFAFPHVVLTFVFAMLLRLELGPFGVPNGCQTGSQIDARKGLKMCAVLESILGSFWNPFGTLSA